MSGKPEVYVSLDIETDGPVPGLYSMLALGAAAFSEDGAHLGSWYATMRPLPGAKQHPETMSWWGTQPDAYAEATGEQEDPVDCIPRFAQWCDQLKVRGQLVPFAKPTGFDYGFVIWYLHRFCGRNPLGIACMDLRSYMAGLLCSPRYHPPGMRQLIGVALAGENPSEGLRPHVAVDDALEQGRIMMALRRWARGKAD